MYNFIFFSNFSECIGLAWNNLTSLLFWIFFLIIEEISNARLILKNEFCKKIKNLNYQVELDLIKTECSFKIKKKLNYLNQYPKIRHFCDFFFNEFSNPKKNLNQIGFCEKWHNFTKFLYKLNNPSFLFIYEKYWQNWKISKHDWLKNSKFLIPL